MCMEDIRVGRRLQVTTVNGVMTAGSTVDVMTRDSTRVRLLISYVPESATASSWPVKVGTRKGTGVLWFACLTAARPWLMLTIEEWGSLVTEALLLFNENGADSEYSITTFTLIDQEQQWPYSQTPKEAQ